MTMTRRIARPEYNPIKVEFLEDKLVITTEKQVVLSYPIGDFPWLEQATEAQRNNFIISIETIHWLELEEGLDMEYLLDWHNDKAKNHGFKATDREWEAIKDDASALGKTIGEYLLDLAADARRQKGEFFPRNPKRRGAPKAAANGRWSGG